MIKIKTSSMLSASVWAWRLEDLASDDELAKHHEPAMDQQETPNAPFPPSSGRHYMIAFVGTCGAGSSAEARAAFDVCDKPDAGVSGVAVDVEILLPIGAW